MIGPVHLVYQGWMPQANALLRASGWQSKRRLKQLGIRAFGELPTSVRVHQRATVHVVRVLGPRQRWLDADNLAIVHKPLIDALVVCGWLHDDKPQWATVTYAQDDTRRGEGPKSEIQIEYAKESPCVP